MGKPVNLNRYRKQKAREQAKARADENALKHGRTKTEKSLENARQNQIVTHLDQHRRDKE